MSLKQVHVVRDHVFHACDVHTDRERLRRIVQIDKRKMLRRCLLPPSTDRLLVRTTIYLSGYQVGYIVLSDGRRNALVD